MRRWHKEQPLLERRMREDEYKHRRSYLMGGAKFPDTLECGCRLGTFRKRSVYGCGCSRRRRRGGCKFFKVKGKDFESRVRELRLRIFVAEQMGSSFSGRTHGSHP
jgi:hypothetical protein